MSLSCFTPCKPSFYTVIDYSTVQNDYTVSATPLFSSSIISKSPNPNKIDTKPVNINKTQRMKKKWSLQLKKIAVAKAKEIGLTKATRFLQINYPNEYSELSPSTLQYWIQKFE